MSVMLIDEPLTKEARTPLITTTADNSYDWRKFFISFIFKKPSFLVVAVFQ